MLEHQQMRRGVVYMNPSGIAGLSPESVEEFSRFVEAIYFGAISTKTI